MKIAANAGEFADALALAAALSDDARVRRIQSLGAIRLTTADAAVEISANVLDHALTLTVPATVETAGALALPGERLAALAAGCPGDREIEIGADGAGARIVCGRSRFRLPAIPQDELPAPLALGQETGRVELAREEALKLFAQPLFAVSDEETRYYLNGVFLHDADGGLVAAGTDGHRLCRVIMRIVGLEWAPDEPVLHLRIPGHDELADDIVDVEAQGAGKTAVQIHHLRELLDELAGERIRLDTSGAGAVILVTDPDDPDTLAAQMPCRWAEQSSQAA